MHHYRPVARHFVEPFGEVPDRYVFHVRQVAGFPFGVTAHVDDADVNRRHTFGEP